MFAFKPDYEASKQRIDAFWECELVDRPVVQFALYKPQEEQTPLPISGHATPADRWMDAEYQAELALASLSNREFLGDTLPVASPNLGPEVFAAFYGCPIHFGDYGTSWTEPILGDWNDVESVQLDWESPYLKKLHEMTDRLLDIGKGKFIVGMADWHPGGDCVAALRDPKNLAMDMLTHVEEVKALLDQIETDYYRMYDAFYQKLRAASQPISAWTTLVSDGKYYIPSNDFSIMISKEMYDDVFLPGLVRECQFLDRSIYHLDGRGALRHLESILGIAELDALQFVPGTGHETFSRWVEVYRRAQAAGKGVQIDCDFSELDQVIEALDPHGVFLTVRDVPSREAAEHMLRELEAWCVKSG